MTSMETTGWRRCRCLLVSVLVLTAGCSESPAQPAGVTLLAPALSAGNYTLRIDAGAVPGIPTVCGAIAINGQAVLFTYAALPVVVTTDGSVWTLRPTADADRGLIITLRVAGATFEGTASGRAIDGLTLLTFGTQGAWPEPARLSGSPIQANVLSGAIAGPVTFERDGASGSCSAYSWLLQPQ